MTSDEEIWFHSVYDLAEQNNIPVFRPKKIDEETAQYIKTIKTGTHIFILLSAFNSQWK